MVAGCVAWIVATSAAISTVWLTYFEIHPSDSVVQKGARLLFELLWLPGKLSDRMFGLANTRYHTPDDVVEKLVMYVGETFGAVFVVVFVVLSIRSAVLSRQSGSQAERTETTDS